MFHFPSLILRAMMEIQFLTFKIPLFTLHVLLLIIIRIGTVIRRHLYAVIALYTYGFIANIIFCFRFLFVLCQNSSWQEYRHMHKLRALVSLSWLIILSNVGEFVWLTCIRHWGTWNQLKFQMFISPYVHFLRCRHMLVFPCTSFMRTIKIECR
jgi:hypothetical protein